MKNISALIALLLITLSSYSQDTNYWKVLKDVEIKSKPDENGIFEIEYPVFETKVKSLDGKVIRLSGYMIPIDELMGHKYFVLSAYPFNMCFFCGMAGPESVIEIYSDKEIDFTSDKITIEGKLELNADDASHLMYILRNAKQIN